MLLLFTTSAQTHIFPEIRIDAVRFLDVFLEYIPQLVISGWREDGKGSGSRVLEGYLGILNAGTRFGETDGKSSFVPWLQTLKWFHQDP
jgi:pre-rRNA-processing protein IPI1